jgi:hypothetical protein
VEAHHVRDDRQQLVWLTDLQPAPRLLSTTPSG